jgi:hypothetical protein
LHVDSFKKEDKKMKITSAVTATVFLLSHIVGVSEGAIYDISEPRSVNKFHKFFANEIKHIRPTDIHRYVANDNFCSYLAYIAENGMKVEVDSSDKKNELLRGLDINEKFISGRIEGLKKQLSDIQQKNPLNFLNHKNIDTEREVNLKEQQRLSSQLNDIRAFLNYCSETNDGCIEESTSGQIVNPA